MGCVLQLHGAGRRLWTTSLSFSDLVISLCISLFLTPPFWKHLIRQMKGRVNGKISSSIFTNLLSQQIRETEIRALCRFVGNGMEDYAKDTLVLYFLMCSCLIFTGFVLVSSHHLLQLGHASQQYSIICLHLLPPKWSLLACPSILTSVSESGTDSCLVLHCP